MTKYAAAGNDFANLFDPDTIGDGPTFTMWDGGVPLRFAALKYGSKRNDIGFRVNGGVDVTNYWAAKGTAVYSLPVHGRTFYSDNQSRGTASIKFNIYANGNFDVQDWRSTTNYSALASGTWLPAGESTSAWTVQFDWGLQNSSTVGGGTNGAEGSAGGFQRTCTVDNYGRIYSTAAIVGQRASTNGTLIATLFKNGVQRSQTVIYTSTNANGN